MKAINNKTKIAYFGMDALYECLALLGKKEYDIVYICTMPDDSYDRTMQIQDYAKDHGIPCDTERVTRQKIAYFESIGVELIIVAGYSWKIPVSASIKQVNIHPAYLPVGRGSWPMPAAILKGVNSGVTLHKLSDRFDEGDILLREEIPIGEEDNLVTLLSRIKELAVRLLSLFLDNVDELWANAYPQGQGEYWQEPGDAERTFALSDDSNKISRILRAFYGYGSLCNVRGIPVEIIRGRIVTADRPIKENELLIKSADAFVYCEEWRMPFRKMQLDDKEKIEKIRKRYQPELSDYTFALLYCWQEEMHLSIYIEEDLFVVKSREYFFFPIGSERRTKEFIDGLLSIGIRPEFHFCDRKMLESVEETYHGKYEFYESRDDSDYVVSNKIIKELSGSGFAKRRNSFAHYSKLLPEPEVEIVTRENVKWLKVISELSLGPDMHPEKIAIDNFFELDMMGIVVKRGTEYVGFSLCSQKDENTMQGHFMKCTSSERGSKFYLMKSCIDAFSDKYDYTNMEDDMGEEGLRQFKSSFEAELVPSYTIIF